MQATRDRALGILNTLPKFGDSGAIEEDGTQSISSGYSLARYRTPWPVFPLHGARTEQGTNGR